MLRFRGGIGIGSFIAQKYKLPDIESAFVDLKSILNSYDKKTRE